MLSKEIIAQTLYYPTNAHNDKNVELLKQFKIKEAAATCFGLQGNHHQGATASAYTAHSTHASLCSHNTDIVCTTSMYPH